MPNTVSIGILGLSTRDKDGVRPPPLNDLRQALAVNDIVIVQPPGFTPDLIRNGCTR